MSIKTRRFIFYFFVALFVLVGSFLTLTSRGYRIDLSSFEVQETGGIYLSSTPQKVKISLDGESIKNQSGLLQKGTLIDGLSPDTYGVSLQLAEYTPWTKQVDVESGGVAVFDSVVLVSNSEPVLLSDSTGSRLAAEGSHIALESGGGVTLNDTLVFGHEIVSLSEGGALLTRSTQTGNYYLTNAFEPEESLNLTLTFNNLKESRLSLPGYVTLQSVEPYPYNDRRFIVSTDRAIYLLNTDRLTLEQIALGPNEFWVEGTNTVFWVEDESIVSYNLTFRTKDAVLDLEELELRTIDRASPYENGWLILSNGILAMAQNGELTPIAKAVSDFWISPERGRIVFLKENGVLAEYSPESDLVLELESSGALDKIAWYESSAHLLVLGSGKLTFTEVDSRNPVYRVDIADNVLDFAYSSDTSFVTYLTPEGVWQKRITK